MIRVWFPVCLLVIYWAVPLTGFSVDLAKPSFHGFLRQGSLLSDKKKYLGKSKSGSFEFSEVRMNLSTQLTDDLRLGLLLFAGDLSNMGNNNVVLDWAFGDYYWKKAVFTGTGLPHRSFSCELSIVNFVSSTPGALGYIDPVTPHLWYLVISIK